MYKKASTRTGGSSLSGWSTRKQTEPKIDVRRTNLVKDWDKVLPRSKKTTSFVPTTILLKGEEVILQKDNSWMAAQRIAKKYRKVAEARREKQRQRQEKRLAKIKRPNPDA